jgi:hypothetical protein
MAERAGVVAATINSANRDDWDAVEKEVGDGRVDLLLVSPERLNNPRFVADVLPQVAAEVGRPCRASSLSAAASFVRNPPVWTDVPRRPGSPEHGPGSKE